MIDSPRQNPPSFEWFRSVSDELSRKSVTVTASYSVPPNVGMVRANATSAVVTVTLPASSSWWSRQIAVKKVDAVHNVILSVSGSDVIDGASAKTLTAQYASLVVISDGAGNWDLI